MKMQELLLTSEEVLALRDALSEETVRMRQHLKAQGSEASKNAIRKLTVLEGLLTTLKDMAFRT